MRRETIVTGLLTLLIVGCNGSQKEQTLDQSQLTEASQTTALSGVDTLSEIIDEQTNQQFLSSATPPAPTLFEKVRDVFASPAFANVSCSSIGRAHEQECVDGEKRAYYPFCSILGFFELEGDVGLEYYEQDGAVASECDMSMDGNYVVKTFDVTRYGSPIFNSKEVDYTSLSNENYLGESVGGGGMLVRNSEANWSLSIIGSNLRKRIDGNEVVNVSLKTIEPVSITGGFDRATRQVDGGLLKIYHNRAKFTASHTYSELRWGPDCRRPIAGKVEITYEGSLTGSASVEFEGCNKIIINKEIALNTESE